MKNITRATNRAAAILNSISSTDEPERGALIEEAVVIILAIRDLTLKDEVMPTKTRRALVYIALELYGAAANVLL